MRPQRTLLLVIAVLLLCTTAAAAQEGYTGSSPYGSRERVNGGICRDAPYRSDSTETSEFTVQCLGPGGLSEDLTGCIAVFTDRHNQVLKRARLNPAQKVAAPNGTRNWELYNCYEDGTQQSSSEGMRLTWPLAFVIAVVAAVIGFVVYLEYKRKEKEDQRKVYNPAFVAVAAGLFAVLAALLMEAFGVVPPGWWKEHWYVFLIVMALAFLVAYNNRQKLKSLPQYKIREHLWRHLWELLRARPLRGDRFGAPILYIKLMEIGDNKEEGKDLDKKITYVVRTDYLGGAHVLVSLDPTNGELIEYIVNPDKQYVKRLLGKEVTSQYDLERRMLEQQTMQEQQQAGYNARPNQTPQPA